MGQQPPPDAAKEHDTRALTIASAVLLAAATLLVAWSGFQNNEWTRERFASSDEATAFSQMAEDLRGAADENEQRDRQLFIAWLDARAGGSFVKTAALESLFRPEFKKVFDNWIDTGPLNDDGTLATSPFERAEYDVNQDKAEAQELVAEARREAAASEQGARRSSDYSFLTVVFAAGLMFVGLSNLFRGRGLRWAVLGASAVLLVAGAAWLVTLPVTIGL